jgi:hypothetical protein
MDLLSTLRTQLPGIPTKDGEETRTSHHHQIGNIPITSSTSAMQQKFWMSESTQSTNGM